VDFGEPGVRNDQGAWTLRVLEAENIRWFQIPVAAGFVMEQFYGLGEAMQLLENPPKILRLKSLLQLKLAVGPIIVKLPLSAHGNRK